MIFSYLNTPFEYIDVGPRDGRPLLFIHGMGLNMEMWQGQIDLFQESHRIISLDLRGHGKSGVNEIQITYRQFVEDIIALLDHLNLDRVILCGLSMGGAIAMRFHELFPQRVLGLVICNSRSEADTNELIYWREEAIKQLQTVGIEPFVNDFMKKIVCEETLSTKPDLVAFLQKMIRDNNPINLARVFLAQAARPDMTDRLDNCKKPALIIGSSLDTLTPAHLMEPMHKRLVKSSFEVIEGCGHLSNLEKPEAFNSLLRSFLQTL